MCVRYKHLMQIFLTQQKIQTIKINKCSGDTVKSKNLFCQFAKESEPTKGTALKKGSINAKSWKLDNFRKKLRFLFVLF